VRDFTRSERFAYAQYIYTASYDTRRRVLKQFQKWVWPRFGRRGLRFFRLIRLRVPQEAEKTSGDGPIAPGEVAHWQGVRKTVRYAGFFSTLKSIWDWFYCPLYGVAGCPFWRGYERTELYDKTIGTCEFVRYNAVSVVRGSTVYIYTTRIFWLPSIQFLTVKPVLFHLDHNKNILQRTVSQVKLPFPDFHEILSTFMSFRNRFRGNNLQFYVEYLSNWMKNL
jgi:hypothetical protein